MVHIDTIKTQLDEIFRNNYATPENYLKAVEVMVKEQINANQPMTEFLTVVEDEYGKTFTLFVMIAIYDTWVIALGHEEFLDIYGKSYLNTMAHLFSETGLNTVPSLINLYANINALSLLNLETEHCDTLSAVLDSFTANHRRLRPNLIFSFQSIQFSEIFSPIECLNKYSHK